MGCVVCEAEIAPKTAPFCYIKSLVGDMITRTAGHTKERFPEANSMSILGNDRWYGWMAWKWGSRYAVLPYRACMSSIARITGYLIQN